MQAWSSECVIGIQVIPRQDLRVALGCKIQPNAMCNEVDATLSWGIHTQTQSLISNIHKDKASFISSQMKSVPLI